MTTAELTGRIELDLYPKWQHRQPANGTTKSAAHRAGLKKKRIVSLMAFIDVVTAKMERSDTLSDRLIGYGLCGITGFYVTAHLVRALF